MHPTYYDAAVRKQIAAAYQAHALPSVQLQGFLEPRTYAALLESVRAAKFSPEVVADRYSRHVAKLTPQAKHLFASAEFTALIRQITGKTIRGLPRLERYSWRDFTLRNDEQKPPGLLVYFDMTEGWIPSTGGATIISNELGELARVPPLPNTLVIIDCSRAWPFIQYINHYAQNRSILRVSWN
jgi:hypothetical protein